MVVRFSCLFNRLYGRWKLRQEKYEWHKNGKQEGRINHASYCEKYNPCGATGFIIKTHEFDHDKQG